MEKAQLEIAEMAGRAGERAASTIAVAVKDLKEEVKRLFVEARRNAGPAVQRPSAFQSRAGVDEDSPAPPLDRE